jgi:hypothetical protein
MLLVIISQDKIHPLLDFLEPQLRERQSWTCSRHIYRRSRDAVLRVDVAATAF